MSGIIFGLLQTSFSNYNADLFCFALDSSVASWVF